MFIPRSLPTDNEKPDQGHYLWNGAVILSGYLQTNVASLIHDKAVLELGAGAGLPSLVAAIYGATRVVVTDYPDADLVENLQNNINSCTLLSKLDERKTIVAEGFLWGTDVASLLGHLPEPAKKFDTLILADLLFNHYCHGALVSTIVQTLAQAEGARALVFFTPYRPWLFVKDMAFFALCTEKGLAVQKVVEEVMETVMFKEDKGDETLRRTVFGYEVRWSATSLEKMDNPHGLVS